MLMAASGCGSESVKTGLDPCEGTCSVGQTCDEDLDECVDVPTVGRGTADLAAGFDVAWVNGEAGVVAYDRLHDRLLYGSFAPGADPEVQWTSPLGSLGFGSGGNPALALLGTSSGPVIYLGMPDGELVRGRLVASLWQWEQLALLGSPLWAIEALYVPEVGYHIVAATEAVETFFLAQQGGVLAGPEAMVDDAGVPLVQPPFSLVRLGGRTTLLASGIAGGLISLSRESPGWTSHLLVEGVDVAAVGLHQTPVGVLTLYVDRADGGLYQVIEDELGTVAVNELAPGVRSPGSPGTPIRIALAAGTETAIALYHDAGANVLRYLIGGEGWAWSEAASIVQESVFLPALVAVPDEAPLATGLDLGSEAEGPGIFRLLALGFVEK